MAIGQRDTYGRIVNTGALLQQLCARCGTSFTVFRSDVNRGRRFCSPKCAGVDLSEHRRGPTHHRYRRATTRCEICGVAFEHVPAKRRRFCSKSCSNRSRKYPSGSANPNWRGGVAARWRNFYLTPEWIAVRDAVLQRDGWRCQHTGCPGRRGKLHVHHIIHLGDGGAPYNDANLITLCGGCHTGHHRRGDVLVFDPPRPGVQ
jgi:5-methylcytosine-specific restriction endonuclease McrA